MSIILSGECEKSNFSNIKFTLFYNILIFKHLSKVILIVNSLYKKLSMYTFVLQIFK